MFLSGCAMVHSHQEQEEGSQQEGSFSSSTAPGADLFVGWLVFTAITMVVKGCLVLVFICISFVTSDVGISLCTQNWDCWIFRQFCFHFFEGLLCCFPRWLHRGTLPPAAHESSRPSPALVFMWCLVVVSILISLMINHIEHLLVCLLALCVSTLENCLCKSFAYF